MRPAAEAFAPPRRDRLLTRRLLAALLVAVGLGQAEATAQTSSASGSARSRSTLFLGAQLVEIAPSATGLGGSFEWLHELSGKASVNTGVLSLSLGETRWTYGRAGIHWRPAVSTTVQAELDLGGGAEGDQGLRYRIMRGRVSRALPGSLVLELEDQLVHVHTTSGNIVKLGLAWLPPSSSFSVRAAAHSTTSGNAAADAVVLRVDREGRRVSVFAGLAAGRSRPVLLQLGVEGSVRTLRQVFGGVSLPLARTHVTLALERIALGSSRRGSLTVSWKVPL